MRQQRQPIFAEDAFGKAFVFLLEVTELQIPLPLLPHVSETCNQEEKAKRTIAMPVLPSLGH